MSLKQIPPPTLERLSLYLRELNHIQRTEGAGTIASSRLARALGINDAQVRKDLAYFGNFGRRGLGYNIDMLVQELKTILGRNVVRPTILVGVGNLGASLAKHKDFFTRGYPIKAIFDSDPKKVGRRCGNNIIQSMEKLEEVIKLERITLAIVAVPSSYAQPIVDRLAACGIAGILNFAPVAVSVPKGVLLRSVDLPVELEQIAIHLD
jgi:redox-sensing transcriptional repressor